MSTDAPLPAHVRIGHVNYRITTDPDEWLRKEHDMQRKGDYGYSEHRSATIYLNPEQDPTQMRLSLWHEVLHAVCESALGSPTWRHLGSEDHEREERVIRMLEAPTLNVLRDNPQLAAFLTEA